MQENILDAIVIGSGPAGLSTSYYLKKNGLDHVVFERGKVAESWRSQRWNSFRLNSPNRLNELPGNTFFPESSECFCSSYEFVVSLENYIQKFQLPVLENALVLSVEKLNDARVFVVELLTNEVVKAYYARQLIIASGSQSEMKTPNAAKNVPASFYQLHASQYREPIQLPDGNVLVVGSAQSGCQIAEDLIDTGRKVFLSTSMVPRVPRSYRGKDIHDWLIELKFFDAKKEQITDPAQLNMKAPQLTGVGDRPKSISLQTLAKKGVSIIGKLQTIKADEALFEPDADIHVKFADRFSSKVKSMIDDFIFKNEINASSQDIDEEDMPDINAKCATSIVSINLKKENITSIIWATGFNYNLSYLKLPVLDAVGAPLHKDGVSEIPGLYFIGFPWLRNRKSSLICGMIDDARFIAEKVKENVFEKRKASV